MKSKANAIAAKQRMQAQEKALDAIAQVRKLSSLQNIALEIAKAQIAFGNQKWNGLPCYKCMMGGKPTIIIAD